MSNVLSMAVQEMISSLLKQGWSKRSIARRLGLHRDTVRRYAREVAQLAVAAAERAGGVDSKQATPPSKVATGMSGDTISNIESRIVFPDASLLQFRAQPDYRA